MLRVKFKLVMLYFAIINKHNKRHWNNSHKTCLSIHTYSKLIITFTSVSVSVKSLNIWGKFDHIIVYSIAYIVNEDEGNQDGKSVMKLVLKGTDEEPTLNKALRALNR